MKLAYGAANFSEICSASISKLQREELAIIELYLIYERSFSRARYFERNGL